MDSKNRKTIMSVKEPIYGQTVCEECAKWTQVAYKCYVATPVEDYKAFIPVGNVVYKCYECAFGDD